MNNVGCSKGIESEGGRYFREGVWREMQGLSRRQKRKARSHVGGDLRCPGREDACMASDSSQWSCSTVMGKKCGKSGDIGHCIFPS